MSREGKSGDTFARTIERLMKEFDALDARLEAERQHAALPTHAPERQAHYIYLPGGGIIVIPPFGP